MAEPYLADLRELADKWCSADSRVGALECRHFFSGTAAYRGGAIAATLTPWGSPLRYPWKSTTNCSARG